MKTRYPHIRNQQVASSIPAGGSSQAFPSDTVINCCTRFRKRIWFLSVSDMIKPLFAGDDPRMSAQP
jgi:hypothetical protein